MEMSIASLDGKPEIAPADQAPQAEGTERELVSKIKRAPTVDAAFAMARAVFPSGVDYPQEVRHALFDRSARDNGLGTCLLIKARQDRDVLQDVLLFWWSEGMDRYEPHLGTVRTYLYRVIFNRMANHRRKTARRGRFDVTASEESVQRVGESYFGAMDLETIARVSLALDAEDPQEALAWLLSKVPRCSNEEIAAITGIPLGSVSRVVKQVNDRLHRRFGDRDLALAALIPSVFIERSGLGAWGRDLIDGLRHRARRALRSTGGRVASYGLAALVGAGITQARRSPVAPPRVVVQRVEVPAPTSAALPPVTGASRGEPAEPPPPAPGAPTSPALDRQEPRRADRAPSRAESIELEHASALAASRPLTALAILAAHRRRWPSSAQALTRDAVEAEALSHAGQIERARVLARQVAAQSPRSAEAHRLRALRLVDPAP